MGAFWYFFSIQRLVACWQRKGACDHNCTGCYGTSFYCDRSSGDLSFINDICRQYVLNTTSAFDFGIFLPALQSGVLESPDFPQKLFFSFWWGMRNLRFAHDFYFSILITIIINFPSFKFFKKNINPRHTFVNPPISTLFANELLF